MKSQPFFQIFLCSTLVFLSFSFIHYQDAKKDAVLMSLPGGACKAGLVNMAIKNNSTTQKIDVVIIKKETAAGLTSTSSTKYSGLPPGYKQPIGCGGTSTKDSLLINYSVGAAIYSSK